MAEDTGSKQGSKRKRHEIFNLTFLESRAGALSLTNQIPFPVKLYQMLDDLEDTGNHHIASWSSDGTCLRVHDPTALVESVLPSYFRQTKYKSFAKQLSLYGFSRISDGRNRGYYYHPDFQRSNKAQCGEIMPIKRKGRTTQDEHSITKPANDSLYPSSDPGMYDKLTTSSPEKSSELQGISTRSALSLSPQEQMRFPPEAPLQPNIDTTRDALKLNQKSASHHTPITVPSISGFHTLANQSSLPGTMLPQHIAISAPSIDAPQLSIQPSSSPAATLEQRVLGGELQTLHRQNQMNASLLEVVARHSSQPIMQLPGPMSGRPPGVVASSPFAVFADNYLSMIPQQIARSGMVDHRSFTSLEPSAFRYAGMSQTGPSGFFPLQNAVASQLGGYGAGDFMDIPFLNAMASVSSTSLGQSALGSIAALEQLRAPSTSSAIPLVHKEPGSAQDSSSRPQMIPSMQQHIATGHVTTTSPTTTNMRPSSNGNQKGGNPPDRSDNDSIDSTLFDAPSSY